MSPAAAAMAPPAAPPAAPSIFDELIDLIEQAEVAADTGHPVDALVSLGYAGTRIANYLSELAN